MSEKNHETTKQAPAASNAANTEVSGQQEETDSKQDTTMQTDQDANMTSTTQQQEMSSVTNLSSVMEDEEDANNDNEHEQDDNSASSTRKLTPLDDAILESLHNFVLQNISATDLPDRIKKLVNHILVIGGGGSLIQGFPHLLTTRLARQFPEWWSSHEVLLEYSKAVASASNLGADEYWSKIPTPVVVTHPRELDPKWIVWKGASVFGKLEVTRDMYTSAGEWEVAREKSASKWLFPLE